MRRLFVPFLIIVVAYLLLFLAVLLSPRILSEYRAQRLRTAMLAVLLVYPGGLVCLTLVHLLLPQEHGFLVLTQIGAPYLFVPLIALIPFAFFRSARLLRSVIGLCLVFFVLRFVSLPKFSLVATAQPTYQVSVLNWNTGIAPGDAQGDQRERVQPVLHALTADIVVLEEAYWTWFEKDAELTARYPHRAVLAWNADKGPILLSRYRILEHNIPQVRGGVRDWPRHILAKLELAPGQVLYVLAAHPPAPKRGTACALICLDTSERDRQLREMRLLADPLIERGERLILLGDLNLTERESLYSTISKGLQDVHSQAGVGLGATWPILIPVPQYRLASAVLRPMLRIDHIFVTENLIPLEAQTDCAPRGSDHCMIRAQIGIP